MEGNIVKAAWVLGGSIFVSTVVFGAGAAGLSLYALRSTGQQAEELSRRSADAVLRAPANTKVALRADDVAPIKIGFEPKLPLALRAENSLDENTGKRAAFEVDVKPNLQK